MLKGWQKNGAKTMIMMSYSCLQIDLLRLLLRISKLVTQPPLILTRSSKFSNLIIIHIFHQTSLHFQHQTHFVYHFSVMTVNSQYFWFWNCHNTVLIIICINVTLCNLYAAFNLLQFNEFFLQVSIPCHN